jgi:hypothetical protein
MIKINGIIIPVNWDADGNITGMAIATHQEEEYYIESDDKTAKLRSLLRQEVRITGVMKSKGEKKIIKIKKLAKKEIDI